MKHHIRKLSLYLLTSLSLICNIPLNSASKTLRIGIPAFPRTLNPVYVTGETSQAVINKMFDSLYCLDGKGHFQKQLVANEKLIPSGNDLVVNLTLERDVHFSNGKRLDAEDVVQTIRKMQDPAFHYPYLSLLSVIEKVERTGPFSLKLMLKQPPAQWRGLLTFKILCKHDLNAMDYTAFRRHIPAGTGPYRVETSRPPNKIRLALNPLNRNYSHNNMFSRLEYIVVAYNHLTPLKLLAGEVDIIELPQENALAYKNLPEWQKKFDIVKYKKTGFTFLVFNCQNPRLTRNIRRIFFNVLIAGDFVRKFLKGGGESLFSPFQSLCPEDKPAKLPTKEQKQRVSFSILTNSESRLRRNFILFLRRAMIAYGIKLEPVFLEYHTMLDRLKKGAFDMALSAYRMDSATDVMEILQGDSHLNYSGFGDKELDGLMETGTRETNQTRRQGIYSKAHALWLEHLPMLPLFNLYYYVGVSRKIAMPAQLNQTVGSSGDFLFNITEWHSVHSEQRATAK